MFVSSQNGVFKKPLHEPNYLRKIAMSENRHSQTGGEHDLFMHAMSYRSFERNSNMYVLVLCYADVQIR